MGHQSGEKNGAQASSTASRCDTLTWGPVVNTKGDKEKVGWLRPRNGLWFCRTTVKMETQFPLERGWEPWTVYLSIFFRNAYDDKVPTSIFIDYLTINGPESQYLDNNGVPEVIEENPGITISIWEHVQDVHRVMNAQERNICIQQDSDMQWYSLLENHGCSDVMLGGAH